MSRQGIGWKRAADLAGVSYRTMSKLLYGGPGSRPPTRGLRPETAASILAVKAGPENLGGHATVPAAGTQRRLPALVALGWPKSELVRIPCLDYALAGADTWAGITTGIWGGTTPRQRAAIRRARSGKAAAA